MRKTNGIERQYQVAELEAAVFNDKQLKALSYENAVRLSTSLLYFVPKQMVHSRDVVVKGVTYKSNKIFAFGWDSDNEEFVTAVEITLSSLTNSHYGPTAEDKPIVEAQLKQGSTSLYVPQSGTKRMSVIENCGSFPLEQVDDLGHVAVPSDCVLTYLGVQSVYVPKFVEKGGKYGFSTYNDNGKIFIDFGVNPSMSRFEVDFKTMDYPDDLDSFPEIKKFIDMTSDIEEGVTIKPDYTLPF